jgi:hypothetical protein
MLKIDERAFKKEKCFVPLLQSSKKPKKKNKKNKGSIFIV